MTERAAGAGVCRCEPPPSGRPGPKPSCLPCRVIRKLGLVLGGQDGSVPGVLAPLAPALAADPVAGLRWLDKPHVTKLLTALASGQVPLTHDGLASWPSQAAARHMRHRLTACGILPAGDPRLLDFEAWLQQRLTAIAGHPHEQQLRQFAHWHLLPRLRAIAAARPLRSTARHYAMHQFTQAQYFLDWASANGISPRGLTQAHLDSWYAGSRVHQRQHAGGFLLWALGTGIVRGT